MATIVPRPRWRKFYPISTGPAAAGEQAEGAIFMQYRASGWERKRRLIDATSPEIKTYYR